MTSSFWSNLVIEYKNIEIKQIRQIRNPFENIRHQPVPDVTAYSQNLLQLFQQLPVTTYTDAADFISDLFLVPFQPVSTASFSSISLAVFQRAAGAGSSSRRIMLLALASFFATGTWFMISFSHPAG